MKMKELTNLDVAGLTKLLNEKREALAKLTFSKNSVPIKNVREMRVLKKDVARLMTHLHSLKLKGTK